MMCTTLWFVDLKSHDDSRTKAAFSLRLVFLYIAHVPYLLIVSCLKGTNHFNVYSWKKIAWDNVGLIFSLYICAGYLLEQATVAVFIYKKHIPGLFLFNGNK